MAARARNVLASAADTVVHHPDSQGFADGLSRALAVADIPYSRAQGKKVAEYILIMLRKLWNAKGDIVALIKSGAKLAGG